jgi:type IV pili sensor histidine kinase/response regulator
MKTLHLLIYVLAIATSPQVVVALDEVARTDRYTLTYIEATSDQQRPLMAITTLSFGKEVHTVGDAIKETLLGSGFQWQSPDNQDQLLNSLPLPAVVREMGPIRLAEALQTIAGEAWILRTDNLHRMVWFEMNENAVNTNNLKE